MAHMLLSIDGMPAFICVLMLLLAACGDSEETPAAVGEGDQPVSAVPSSVQGWVMAGSERMQLLDTGFGAGTQPSGSEHYHMPEISFSAFETGGVTATLSLFPLQAFNPLNGAGQ